MDETCWTSAEVGLFSIILAVILVKLIKNKKKTKFRLLTDLPLDSSPWQKRAGVPFSHTGCPRPPRSYSGSLDCPWFVRQRCVLDAGTDCIQHPRRGAAETETVNENEQNTCGNVALIRLLLLLLLLVALTDSVRLDTNQRRTHTAPPFKLLLWLLATPS